jgi:DnaJ-domain-containing protein 1
MNRLDLIIDALEKAKDGWQSFDEYEKALAAARELHEVNQDLLEALKRIAAPNTLNADDRVEVCREALREIARAVIAKLEEESNEP